MDLLRILDELYTERTRLEKIIGTLEVLDGAPAQTPKKRGRKFMDPAGRKDVSQRMKRYWAKRREAASNSSWENASEPSKAVNE